jgi:nucleoside-diphosphate-sugar epimerase
MSRFVQLAAVVFAALMGSLRSYSVGSSRAAMTMMASKYLGKSPVFVAGGSRGVGLEVVKKLSAMGTPVRALVRRSESVAELNQLPGVKAVMGDAMDEAAVQSCMEGCVAAVTTLGGKPEEGKQRVDYVGNSNVIEQAGILGVERIVLVTSVGCGTTKGAVSQQVYQVLEEALVAKNKAERDLRTYTNLDWTIIRPGGLKSEPATGKAILTPDIMASGVINRVDVADLVVQVRPIYTLTRPLSSPYLAPI